MENKRHPVPEYWLPLSLVILLLVSVREYLFRQFWFDEALTLMNFAWMPDPLKIYSSYVIPNNQIIYTVCLHYWSKLADIGLRQDFSLRLLSLLFAAGTLCVLSNSFKRLCGRIPLWISLAALLLSPPFLIYASALRGYMASCFFVSLALVWGKKFIQAPSGRSWAAYFAGCLLCVGTIPSNLLALGGVVCYLLPRSGKKFLSLKRTYLLALTPFAALGAFYLPIAKSFFGVFRLGEGWSSNGAVLTAYLFAVIGVFGVLLLPGIISRSLDLKNWRRGIPVLVFLLPVIAVFCLHKPPFPRVFFPLFPVLALVVAEGIRAFSVLLKKKKSRRVFYAFLTGIVLLWGGGFAFEPCKTAFSKYCGNAPEDDFFYGYYMRRSHVPEEAARRLTEFYTPGRLPGVYLSFSADPWPVMFYLLAQGYQTEFLFDGPRGKISELPPGAVVIINRGEEFAPLEKRFSVALRPLFETAMHKIAAVE